MKQEVVKEGEPAEVAEEQLKEKEEEVKAEEVLPLATGSN